MNEQGRAAVLGWQQTVDAAWQRQSLLLAGPVPQANAAAGITIEQLRAIMPTLSAATAQEYLPLLNAAMAEAEINTPKRQAAFLAQLAHESKELTSFMEGGPPEYFRKYDPGTVLGKKLGNTQPGDGLRYKGRGPIQLTGRYNYRVAGQALGLDLVGNPPLAAEPSVGFRTAGWFWRKGNGDLNPLADAGNFKAITKRINGGYTHLAERQAYYVTAKRVLGG